MDTGIATSEWKVLQQHCAEMKSNHLRELNQNPQRSRQFSLHAAGITLDYSRNFCNPETIALLTQLARASHLRTAIKALFTGEIVNRSENQPALHTALRHFSMEPIYVESRNVVPDVHQVWHKMQIVSEQIRQRQYFGYNGKPLVNIVNIGIGGSDLGPKMVTYALDRKKQPGFRFYYISNLDNRHIAECLNECKPENTLFIVSSKTFTTQETLANLTYAKKWMQKTAGNTDINMHFIAVTTAAEKALEQGFLSQNIFPFWYWVGGRFSIWSAVSLSFAIAVGMERFKEFLAGAYLMDQHFAEAPFELNMPVLLALLGIWYNNFFNWHTQAIIPYSQSLVYLPDYMQQLHMESLGKSVQQDGTPVDYATGYVLWGGVGTNSQHSFHQLLLQGTPIVPCDFVLPLSANNIESNHDEMFANCLAQSETFAFGHEDINAVPACEAIYGNRPHNLIKLDEINSRTLGALIAMYEHKIYAQSIIWRINAFDQWGVQRGKKLAQDILSQMRTHTVASV